MSHILVATGVQREAATLGTFRQVVIPGGGDAVALRQKLEAAAEDAIGIVSFGLGGALDGSLRIGDWVIGEQLAGSVEALCDPDWIRVLQERHPGARVGTIYSDGQLASTAGAKAALADKHHALVVDMESHVAASVAKAHDLPFAILRCVSDTMQHTLPPAIAVAMRADGSVNGPAMLRSILAKPRQMPALARSIAGFLKAMRALKMGGAWIPGPCKRTVRFSQVMPVSSEFEFGNSGRRGWGFDVISDSPSLDHPYRAFLEKLTAASPASNLVLPPWEEHEDCVEGSLDWRGTSVRVYYEPLLNFVTFWSLDRDTVADLRNEVIRLAGRLE